MSDQQRGQLVRGRGAAHAFQDLTGENAPVLAIIVQGGQALSGQDMRGNDISGTAQVMHAGGAILGMIGIGGGVADDAARLGGRNATRATNTAEAVDNANDLAKNAPNSGAFGRGTLSAARISEEALGEFTKTIKVGSDEIFVRFKQSKLGDTLVVRDFEILNAKDYFGRAPVGKEGVRKVYIDLLEDAKARGFDHIEIHYDRIPVLADQSTLRPSEINDLVRDIVIADWLRRLLR